MSYYTEHSEPGTVESTPPADVVVRPMDELRRVAERAAEQSTVPESAPQGAELVAVRLQADTFLAQLGAVLPAELDARTIVHDAMAAVAANRSLADCPVDTILRSVTAAAQLGLRIGVLGHSWLVPRWNGHRTVATLTLGYQGLLDLSYRSGMIQSATVEVITRAEHEAGAFSFRRTAAGDDLQHTILWDAIPEPGSLKPWEVGWYARIVLTTGGHIVTRPWGRAQMEQHAKNYAPRDRETKEITGPWRTHFNAMARKTMLLTGLKTAPKSPMMARALSVADDMREADTDASDRDPGDETT